MTIRTILEAFSKGETTRAQARTDLMSLGMTGEEADHTLFIESGGDDVIDLDEQP